MRQVLYKSGLMCMIFFLVSIIINFCITAYIKTQEPEKVISAISDNYYLVERKGEISLEKFRRCFASVSPGLYGVVLENKIVALSGDDYVKEDLSFISGRYFNKNDYKMGTDTIIIREKWKMLCHKEHGKLYYHYNGYDFLVIGIYKDALDQGITAPDCFINLFSARLKDISNWKVGFADGITDREAMIKVLGNYDMKSYRGMDRKNKYFVTVADNSRFMIYIYLGLLLMILLHSFMAIETWIDGRKKEIAVRKLVGASDFMICKFLVQRFMIILLVVSAIGMGVAQLILILNMKYALSYTLAAMMGERLYPAGMLLSMLFFILLGGLLISINLLRMKHKFVTTLIHEQD